MVVSSEQIREIDISRPARALYFLRLMDYLLVILCGNFLVIFLAMPFIDAEMRQGWELVFNLVVLVPVLCFLVYTGWRHVGVIDVGVWRAYMIAFPLLLLFSVFVAWGLSISSTNNGGQNPDQGWFLVFLMSAGAIVGFRAVLLLKKMRIATFGVPLVELLRDLNSYKGQRAVNAKKIRRVNVPRGTVLGVLGGIIVLSTALAPLLIGAHVTDDLARSLQKIGLLGCFLLIRARRYFQVSADSLLAVDKRKPILFLRSFEDDEKVNFNSSETALLDFSLETRLSNHFTYFGPFIAIGSPKEPLPQIGAARTILSDAEWQPRVMAWMSAASAIVMYSGKSQWVTWELAKVVNTERVAKLILMIPEVKGWRSAIRSKDIAARMELARQAFMNTKWRGPLNALQNFRDVRAMLFRSDGSLIVIKSRASNRDSCHLAALIAHYILLKETAAMLVGISGAVQDRQFPVDTDKFHIGAAPDNNLIIKDDDYVSGHHAFLCYEKGSLSIADQHSKNGTFVNGNRLGDVPIAVNAGDQICMGHSIFEVAHATTENRLRAA
jgi:FHA domain